MYSKLNRYALALAIISFSKQTCQDKNKTKHIKIRFDQHYAKLLLQARPCLVTQIKHSFFTWV